ncbi:serine protease 1-like [Montipora foliosa]|uniref:serine protease 1-like n=1 Tax=Montipora foliosa TaxID=591990 RepID=UPI0035F1F797
MKFLCTIFAVSTVLGTLTSQYPESANCKKVLQALLKKPPPNTEIAINLRLLKARYRCRKGFNLVGKQYRTCKNGTWMDMEDPKCIGPQCGKPKAIPHATFVGSSYGYKDPPLKYSCESGYTLNGPRQRRCRRNGRWSKGPTCMVSLDYSPCGESPVDFRARNVGGSTSSRGWWPWQVALKKPSINGGYQLFCGGALISPRWVLTAASCFYTPHGITSDDLYKISAGDHRLDKEEKSEQDILPEKLKVHEDYNARTFLNDIALIKLEYEVELNKFVRTLCLPSKEEEGDLAVAGKYGCVSGWGVTRALEMEEKPKERDYSNKLKYAFYQIQTNALCKNSTKYTFESDAMFCGGDGKGGNDTCSGDSGGVFVREGKRGNGYRWIATGIVSWGEGCAQKNKYGYYTRVYSYIDWIKKMMTEN